MRRAFLLVATLVFIMGMTVIASEGVREKVFNYFSYNRQGYLELSPLDDNNLPEFKLGYVPEGYKLLNKEYDNTIGYWLDYSNDKNEHILFSVYKRSEYISSVDTDSMKCEQTHIGSYEAMIFYDDHTSIIIWQVGDFTLQIYCGEKKNSLIRMAKNVSKNN